MTTFWQSTPVNSVDVSPIVRAIGEGTTLVLIVYIDSGMTTSVFSAVLTPVRYRFFKYIFYYFESNWCAHHGTLWISHISSVIDYVLGDSFMLNATLSWDADMRVIIILCNYVYILYSKVLYHISKHIDLYLYFIPTSARCRRLPLWYTVP